MPRRLGCAVVLISALCSWPTGNAPAAERAPTTEPSVTAPEDALDRRLRGEQELTERGWPLLPHRGNYGLAASYNARPNKRLDDVTGRDTKHLEVKLQISLKWPIMPNLVRDYLGDRTRFYFGYTQQSYWQLYSVEDSSPFRETNYEPELFVDYRLDPSTLFGRRLRLVRLGLVPQSNGQSDPLSRSWNRLQAELLGGVGKVVYGLRTWVRVDWFEDTDDNPNIEDYVGRVELSGRYVFSEKASLGLTVKDNLRWTNRGSALVELSYAPRFFSSTALYAQYFIGYGENLLDYDHLNNRVSVGAKLLDWL